MKIPFHKTTHRSILLFFIVILMVNKPCAMLVKNWKAKIRLSSILGSGCQPSFFFPKSSIISTLFDLDGTISDSDPIHFEVAQTFFPGYGIPVDHDFFMKNIHGRSNVDVFGKFFGNISPEKFHEITEQKEQIFRRKCQEGGLKPVHGCIDFLAWLKDEGIRVAVVTNAPRANAECMIDALGLRSYIEDLIIGDECARGKPAPDPYLEGARRLGVEMDQVIVFEDSATGIQSANTAKAKGIVGVCTTIQKDIMAKKDGVTYTIHDYEDTGLKEYIQNQRNLMCSSVDRAPAT